jgi:hypothetical protein
VRRVVADLRQVDVDEQCTIVKERRDDNAEHEPRDADSILAGSTASGTAPEGFILTSRLKKC